MTTRLLRAVTATAALACAALFHPAASAAQQDTTVAVDSAVRVVRLADGSVLYGRLVRNDPDGITVVTQSGARIDLQRAQVRSIEPLRGTVRNGEVWPADPNGTRLLFGPTARTLAHGEGHIADYELVLPFVDYGLTDRLTISAGTPLVPGALGQAYYAELRAQIVSAPRMKISAGTLAFATDVSTEAAGVVYGAGTFGSDDQAVTVAAAFPFITGEGISQTPVMMAGGEYRVGRRAKLLTENYFIPGESDALLTGGVRFIGERLTADLGLGFVASQGCSDQCFLPIVNFVYSFGRRR